MLTTSLKIIRVKFVNHLIFKDLDISFDNSVVTILGHNGAGKSYLARDCTPLASNSRSFTFYPFLIGETGFKQVDYVDQDGTIYETIHELIPKSHTHSCKSYFNIIQNGIKTECNPTGHSEFYKEMIKKHLHFDSSVLETAYISNETVGIVSTSMANRKKILETTCEIESLKKFRKNSMNMNRRYKEWSNYLERDVLSTVNKHSKESLGTLIADCKNNIESNNKNIEILENKIPNIKMEIIDTKKLHSEDLVKITKTKNIIQNTSKTLNEHYNIYQNSAMALQKADLELSSYSSKLQSIKNKKNVLSQMEAYRASIDEAEKDIEICKSNIAKVLVTEEYDKAIDIFADLVDSTKVIQNAPKVLSKEGLKEQIATFNKRKQELDEIITKFDYSKRNANMNKDYYVEKAENCNVCDLFKQFYESKEFVTKYLKTIDSKREESNELFHNSGELKIALNVLERIDGLFDKVSLYFKKDMAIKLGIDSADSLLKKYSNGNYSTLLDAYVFVTDEITKIRKKEHSIKETKLLLNQISEWNSNDINLDEEHSLITKITEIQNLVGSNLTIKEEYEKLFDGIDINIYMAYSNMTYQELEKLYNEISTIDTKLKKLYSELEQDEKELAELKKTLTNETHSLVKAQNDLKTYIDTYEKYEKYTKKLTEIERVRQLLDKDIPIAMMRNNLEFIEKTVNMVLTDNGYDISIQVITTEKEIIIPANVGTKSPPDVSTLSSGEKCIVSLLINAAITHLQGYPIMVLDEADANLSVFNKAKFSNLIYSIMSVFGITQIIAISHNIASDISGSTKIIIGNDVGLEIDYTNPENIIKI